MNQQQIAEKINVTQGFISQVLSGKRSVSKEMAIRLSKEFGNDPAFWIFASPSEIQDAIDNHDNGGNRG